MVCASFQVLFSFLCSQSTNKDLKRRAIRFRAHLTKKFQWDFEEDPLDCAPVVVQLPEDWESENKVQNATSEGNKETALPS